MSKLAPIVNGAIDKLNLKKYNLEIIGDKKRIKNLGVKKLPALVINDKILIEGRLPSLNEVIKILKSYNNLL
ncbi:MAG: thioredoxin family protein [Firmicutes bacterium]|nr:thioredoxin family protein [Bacillota bacterium]